MRICLVSQEYPPETGHGGIASQSWLKAQGLVRLGHDVHVVSHSSDGRRRDGYDGTVGITRLAPPDRRLEIRSDAVRWLAYSQEVAAGLAELEAERPFDLIDFPEWGAEGFIYLLNRDRARGPKVVVQLHGPLVMLAHALGWPDPESEFYRIGTFMEATCLRLADAVFSSSELSARWCREWYGLSSGPIPVLHTGVDTKRYRPLEISREERPTLVFIGKVGPSKGADLLVEVAIRIARRLPDLCLRLFGPDVDGHGAGLQARAVAAGLGDLLEIRGVLPREQAAQELVKGHVFVSPSPYEGGPGFVCLEAMACGLPVVACSGSGMDEVVTPEVNGLLVPPGDAEALEGALWRLLSEPELRAEMGERGRRYVQEQADSERCVARIASFYEAGLSG